MRVSPHKYHVRCLMKTTNDDDMPTWLALPLIAVVLTYWYAQQSPENHQTVMQYLAIAATWLKWAMSTPSTGPNRVAGAGTNLYALATLVVVGMIIGGLIYVIIELARRNGMGKGRVDSTAAKLAAIRRHRGQLPRKFPKDICAVVEDVLAARGGLAEDGDARFWVERAASIATPLYWRLAVDYAPGADPQKLAGMVSNINDRLIRRDLDANAIIDYRPLSIVINNPNPPTFTLADYWPEIAKLPQNELLAAGSVHVEKSQMALTILRLEEQGAGTLLAGKAGAGKTQFAMSLLLSMCMANSPQRLALFIADIKKIDTMALAGLPHLAAPIASDAATVADILAAMVAEMMRRSQISDRDRSWEGNAIAIYIDELATLLSMAGDRKGEIIEHINNLARTGRALGMIVIAATQRVVEIETEVFTNLGRRCILRCNKISDSNHATGAKETTGHKLPFGAVSIHDAGDSDGELSRGLFVGKTKDGFAQIVAPFLADIQRRHAGIQTCHIPIKRRIDHPQLGTIEITRPQTPPAGEPVEPAEPTADDDNLHTAIIERLPGLRQKYGADLVATWVTLAMEGNLSANLIRKATRVNGEAGSKIREQILEVTRVVKNTHVFESSV